MLFGFTKQAVNNLHHPTFYMLSCISNMITIGFAYYALPVVGEWVAGVGIALMIAMMIEHELHDVLSKREYNNRYTVKILAGMTVITLGVVYIDRDYILYLPILMGMVYMNVNTIIKNKWLHYVLLALMFAPAVKVIATKPQNMLEYLCVIFLFISVSLLSSTLFRTNKETLEAAENTSMMMKSVHKLVTHLTRHDVRNELQKMQILGTATYRKNQMLFLETMHKYQSSIEQLVDNNIFDDWSSIDVADMIDNLSHVTSNKNLIFSVVCEDSEPVFTVKNMLYSTLKNIIENSVEASNRKGIVGQMTIVKTRNRITCSDNCGGFDVSSIAQGHTSKKHGQKSHGVFLYTITNPAIKTLFGFSATVRRIENGTCVELTFGDG